MENTNLFKRFSKFDCLYSNRQSMRLAKYSTIVLIKVHLPAYVKEAQENGGKGIDWHLLCPTKQVGEPILGTYIKFCRS